MANAVQITGLQEVIAGLKSVPREIRRFVPPILAGVGKGAKGVAKAAVPVDTGALKSSIQTKAKRSGKEGRLFVQEITAGDRKIKRGEGEFKTDAMGQKASGQPTSYYAGQIDYTGGKGGRGKGYMSEHAFGYAKSNTLRKILSIVVRTVQRRFAGL